MIKQYIYLLSYGRSGSTLLDWLMDTHHEILGLGEVYRIRDAMAGKQRFPEECACGVRLEKCPFWTGILGKLRAAGGSKASFEEFNRVLIKESLAGKPGATVIFDSSGNLERLERLSRSRISKEYSLKVVFLTRDARGVVFSASQRGYDLGRWRPSLIRAAMSWRFRNSQYLEFYSCVPRRARLHVTYEHLTTRPEQALFELFDFIGVPRQDVLSDWRNTQHHTFAGNKRLRRSTQTEIIPDRKWSEELSGLQRFIIDTLTRGLNERFMRGLDGESLPALERTLG